ncbi:hypothetical protein, partial [Deinococcus wulumuqiensis]
SVTARQPISVKLPEPKRTSKATLERVVYELQHGGQTHQCEAASTKDLKGQLERLMPGLDSYSVQALAHVVHASAGSVIGRGWSVRRVGVLRFEPDQTDAAPQRVRQSKSIQEASANSGSNETLDEALDRLF